MKRLLTPILIFGALMAPAAASAAVPNTAKGFVLTTPITTVKGSVSIWTFAHHSSSCIVYSDILYRRWPKGHKPGPWYAILPNVAFQTGGLHAVTTMGADLKKPYRWQIAAQSYADCAVSHENVLLAWHVYGRPPKF